MKIYAGICGIGLGHMARSSLILNELKRKGCEVFISTYGPAHDFALKLKYKAKNSPQILWAEDDSGAISLSQTLIKGPKILKTLIDQYNLELQRLEEFKPDVVFCDSRYTTLYAAIRKKIPVYLLTNILHFVGPKKSGAALINNLIRLVNYKLMTKVKRILVPDFPKPYTISKNNLHAPKTLWGKTSFIGPMAPFIGSNSRKLTQSDIKKTRRELGFNNGLFLFAPLSGPGNSRKILIKPITKIANKLGINTLITTGDPKQKDIKEESCVKIMNWIDNKKAVLASCDLVISRPGLSTIGEEIALGIPSILVPTPHQREQELNANGMAALGASIILSQKHALKKKKLESAVKKAIDKLPELKTSAEILSKESKKYNPAKIITNEILNNSKSY